VRVRVDVCGICGTDVEEYLDGPNITPLEPNPLTHRCAPLTMGHEIVGVVEEVGAGVEFTAGTRVAVEANIFCGTCYWCQRHQYPLCVKLTSLGQHTDGGLAEAVLAPAYMCLPYRADVAPERMALAEPLAVAVRAVRRAGIQDGSTATVIGSGTIGLLTIQAARLAGATTVIAIDRHESRRALAIQLGATSALAPEEAADGVAELTAGVGTDVSIESAGNTPAALAAIDLVRKGGRAVLLGVYAGTIPVDMMSLLMAEKEIAASLSHVYDEDFAKAVSLIEHGKVDVIPLITDRIALDDIVEKGFKALAAEPERHLKILVRP
jgi:(R,R)-butanediol dehydrogenase/meso-butanediol dehydrogenase/diacetyl reductase